MKKPFKIVLTIFIVIVVLCTAGAILYKPVYNVVAPIVFDEFVAKNLDKIINSEDVKEETKSYEKEEASLENDDTKEEKTDDNEEKKEGENSKKSDKSGKKDDGVYSTKTTVGVYTEHDLSYLIKVISPQDKARIISILQSCVASSDYPDMARRVSDGLDNADMAYIERYLRARMTIPQKQAILDIVDKYI